MCEVEVGFEHLSISVTVAISTISTTHRHSFLPFLVSYFEVV